MLLLLLALIVPLVARARARRHSTDAGFAALIVGEPAEDDERLAVAGAGAVNILYGSMGGQDDSGNQLWRQSSPGISDNPEDRNGFGAVLVALPPAGRGAIQDLYLPQLARE